MESVSIPLIFKIIHSPKGGTTPMASRQGAALERKKLLGDPIMVTTIVVLIAFLTLFILYPLAILLVDSVYSKDSGLTMSIFQRIFAMGSFRTAITNTLKVGFTVGIFSTIIIEYYIYFKFIFFHLIILIKCNERITVTYIRS